MTVSPTERTYLAELRRLLVQRFSLGELRTICFDLGIDAESVAVGGFGGPAKPGLVHGLLEHLDRRHRIPELIAYITTVRSDLATDLAELQTPPLTGTRSLAANRPPAPVSSRGATVGQEFALGRSALGLRQQSAPGTSAPEIVWSFDLPGQPMAAPVVVGATCLFASQESGRRVQGAVLRALDLARGVVIWEHHFENAIAAGLARASDTQVLLSLPGLGGEVAGHAGSEETAVESALVAIDAGGQIVWRTEFEAHQISAPAVGGGLIALTASRREVMLLDLATGRELAVAALPVDVALVAPACDREGAYIPCRTPTLVAIDPHGELRWRYDVDSVLSGVQFNQTPLITQNLIIATLSSGVVVALSRDDGAMVWEAQVGPRGKQTTAPVSDGHRVYVGARDSVVALDLATGSQQWRFQTGVYATAPPALLGDWLCVAGHDRHLYGLARHTGEVAWQVALPQEVKTSPALANGGKNGPYAIVVDCTGDVRAVAFPVPAEDHEAAGRWEKAADVWLAAGEVRRAAEAWVRRAQQLLEEPGLSPSQEGTGEQAEAWMAAARLLDAVGAMEEGAQARERYAVLLGLPAITVQVHHNGLVLGAWSTLTFTIKNHGYGVARNLVICLAGEQFTWQAGDGQVNSTEILEMPVLRVLNAGQEHRHRVTAQPLAHGESVPIGLQIAYLDRNGEPHRLDEMLKVTVAREGAPRIPETLHFAPPSGAAPVAASGLRGDSLVAPPPVPAVNLEIRVGRGPDDYSVELTLDRGSGTPPQVFAGGHMPLSVASWVASGDPVQDGQRLFAALFHDDAVRKGWHVARGQAEDREGVRRIRLRIDEGAAELHRLPWELLHEEDVMLTASQATPFSRYIPVDRSWGKPAPSWPIGVLGVVANPRDLLDRYGLAPLNVALEKYILASAFAEIDARRIRLEFLKPPITLERLSRAMLNGGYRWLHFVGHTRLNTRQARVDLLMEDDHGTTRAIADHLFCRMLAHQGVQPQLVYLSACHSATGPFDGSLGGLAPKLAQVGVPAVVAMQGQVPVRVAQRAAHLFYAGLIDHGAVDRAMNQVRAALMAAELPNVADPVLYMRLSSARLWDET